MNQTVEKISYSDKPFLTIITRCFKRLVGLNRNQESINSLTDKSIEQILITDHEGVGLLEANRSFSDPEVLEMIEGEYVFLLDDDDFITNPKMVEQLQDVVMLVDNFDIIFFRMNIIGGPNGDLYPTHETWEIAPKIAHIGGSCFAVRADIYKEFIHNFAHVRCGDYMFLEAIWKTKPRAFWLNELMCQTGQIGRGRPE